MPPTKSERLELRVSKSDRALIEEAAEAVQESVSDFTRSAALTQAERVLARANVTLMEAEQFDALLQSLDEPDEAPTLARAFKLPKRYTRA